MNESALKKPTAILLMLVLVLLIAGCWVSGDSGEGNSVSLPSAQLALFSGHMGGQGNVDGVGADARFFYPFGITTDPAGNAYVADTSNHVIRKISPDGEVKIFAGSLGVAGSADGQGGAASFNFPNSVATDVLGNLYVADVYNHLIRKITPGGLVSTLAGTAGASGSADGTGAAARFFYPNGVATDSSGNIFVADSSNSTIRKITTGGVVTTFAGLPLQVGSADGAGTAARFFYPFGVATDSAGYVYVADTNNHTIRIITPAGGVSTLAGTAHVFGSADGTGSAALFNLPNGVATDAAGNVYVADSGNSTIRKINTAGVVNTLAGLAGSSGSVDGAGSDARFLNPNNVSADTTGNLYVADTFNHSIRKITPAGTVSTLAGLAVIFGSADGTGGAARFNYPIGICTDAAGNVYMADTGNHIIRKITPAGVSSTLAGLAGVAGSNDGTGATARFNYPFSVSADNAGNVFVADTSNHTIRKITPAGVVSTFAGVAGVHGSANGLGASASFYYPNGVATDTAGNVYVADYNNSTVRKITPAGLVSTFAGTAGVVGSVDGTGSAARFSNPESVTSDSQGNIYVADFNNSTIRKITSAGVVTTFAGMAGITGSSDGTGAAARFNQPRGVTTDSAGYVYVSDTYNHTIRRITPAGVVNTIVGVAGQRGFSPGALPGHLSFPKGLTVSGGNLYVTLYSGVAVVSNRP